MIYNYENAGKLGRTVKVFLDGKELDHDIVEMADTENGFVVVAEKDAGGNLVVEGDCFKREKIHGTVTVELVAD